MPRRLNGLILRVICEMQDNPAVVITAYKAKRERYEYRCDKETDILVIELSSEKADFGEQKGNIITHYNKENKLIEIEILEASKTALEILKAMPPKKVAATSG